MWGTLRTHAPLAVSWIPVLSPWYYFWTTIQCILSHNWHTDLHSIQIGTFQVNVDSCTWRTASGEVTWYVNSQHLTSVWSKTQTTIYFTVGYQYRNLYIHSFKVVRSIKITMLRAWYNTIGDGKGALIQSVGNYHEGVWLPSGMDDPPRRPVLFKEGSVSWPTKEVCHVRCKVEALLRSVSLPLSSTSASFKYCTIH